MWWWHIFRYFEVNVPVCLPREFGWPIPKAIIRSKLVQYIYQKLKTGRRRGSSTSEETGNTGANLPNPINSQMLHNPTNLAT